MTRPGRRRTAMSLASLALAVGALTGCGGGDGESAPEDTSTADFCESYTRLLTETVGSFSGGEDPDVAELVPTLKEYAAQLAEVGTPADIPEDARRGFEVSLASIEELPDDATQEDLLSQGDDATEEEQADAMAFATYVQSTCPDALDSLVPSGAATPAG